MTEYRYAMVHRPFDFGCQPRGHVAYEPRDKTRDGMYGIVTYARKLTDDEISRYELRAISSPDES